MLDISSLAQLKELKKQIQASVIRSKGIVKGTSKRFGFVVDDKDGQQYLLPQSSMDLLLPGDHIQFILEKGNSDDDRPIAVAEKLLNSELKSFIGQIKTKGNNLFVISDLPYFSRWVFIPPKFRENLQDGDLVHASVTQHPFQNKGFTQAKIESVLGKPDDPYIEHRYAIAKAGISEKVWQCDEIEAIRQTSERLFEQAIGDKVDCTTQLFFTIDGVSTQDLDDALAIEKTDFGWRLQVAIADVSTYVAADSPLDKIAAKQALSIYLPGQKLPMLPEVLSADLCSLRADKKRLVLICSMDIDAQGHILHCEYIDGIIKSRARLNYDEVTAFLETGTAHFSGEIQTALHELEKLSQARGQWRKTHAIAGEEYPDFRLWLNEKGKITHIERLERNAAQYLVEECMLACNEATANFISTHSEQGLYLQHNGFREEQIPGIKKLLQQYFPEQSFEHINTLAGYCQLVQQITQTPSELPWREIFRKKLNRSEWGSLSMPHFGLGFTAYTTFTSPIRKYSDLLIHRLIKSIIGQGKKPQLSNETIEQLNNATQAIRFAQRDCENSLKCQYIQTLAEQSYIGEIAAITARNVSIYLAEFDMYTMLDLRSLEQEFTFKADTFELVSEKYHFILQQKIAVKIDNVDVAQRLVRVKLEQNDALAN